MSPSIKQKKASLFLVALVLACFAISRSIQAAQPPDIQNVFNTPFQRRLVIDLPPGLLGRGEVVAIPAGKTLVVEFVSVKADFPAGEQPIAFFLETDGGQYIAVDLFMNFQASADDRDAFVGSQQIRLYAKNRLGLVVHRDVGAGAARIFASFIGYLVNTP